MSRYGEDQSRYRDAVKKAKIIRAKRVSLKICLGLLSTTILLKITTIECSSNHSSESTSTTPVPSTGEEYFTSIVKMKELAGVEKSLISEMNTVVENFGTIELEPSSSEKLWQEGLSKIKSYIHDYDSSIRPMLSDTADVETAVVAHPLMSYRMLRRVVFNLPEILHYNIEKRLEKLANVADLIRPTVTEDDVIGAMEGILRLQKTYLISPYDFSQGRLRTYDTKSGLTVADCYHIGNLALNENRESSTAVEWLVQALRMCERIEVGSGIPIEKVRNSLRKAIEVHNNEVENGNSWTFGKAIQINLSEMTRDNENESIKLLPPHPSLPPYQLFLETTKFDDKNFNGLCRGDKLRNDTLTKNLKCYYKTDNPFLAIKPLKVEVHSEDPLILQFYDFISNSIIKNYINANIQFNRARIDVSSISKFRIACNDWIDDKSDEILSTVPKIIHESTGLNLIPETSSERSQISTYGGYYDPHYDTLYHNRECVQRCISKGERIATIMFYLSDLKLGGGTAFPKIGVYAEPIKGSAIFWYNMKQNGLRDDTMHGGCPVLFGQKWVVNKWILSKDQMFFRKCSLDANK